MSERTEKPLVVLPGPVQGTSRIKTAAERRLFPRFPFTAAALVLDVLTQTRVVGRSGDLGLGGCYIDTMCPFPSGASVRISVERDLNKFEALATVTYSLQSMGMGLAFTDIKSEHRAVLQRWIAELSGERIPEPAEVVAEEIRETEALVRIGNLRQVLNELINLMIRRKSITEKEGAELLRQMFHQ